MARHKPTKGTSNGPAEGLPHRERVYPKALRESEQELRGRPLEVGLALSGGGIRSATFCFGVLQALAKHEVLKKIDVMSTVSGGGYIGGMLTRLFTRKGVESADDAGRAIQPEDQAADRRTSESAKAKPPPGAVVRWLRENGRYLAPKGAGDLLLAATVGLRNWLSLHVVLGTLLFGLFLAMQIPREFTGQIERLLNTHLPLSGYVCWSPWLALSFLLVPLAALLAWIHWLIANRGSSQESAATGGHGWTVGLKNVLIVLLVALGLAGVDTLGQTLYGQFSASGLSGRSGLASWVVGLISAALSSRTIAAQFGPADDRQRARRLFRFGAGVLAVLLYGSLFVLLNVAAHAAAWGFKNPDCSTAPPTPRIEETLQAIHLELAGVHQTLASGEGGGVSEAPDGTTPRRKAGERRAARKDWYCLLFVSLIAFMIAALVRRNFLNNSALLPLYTARLARAYLGASNPKRIGPCGTTSAVTQPIGCDDVDFRKIRSATWERGPVHLVNTTLNETVHGTSRLQQGDRQGVGLAVGPAGLSVGLRHHVVWNRRGDGRHVTVYPERQCGFRVFDYPPADRAANDDENGQDADCKSHERQYLGEDLSLGQWMAISGAAFSTGMGKNTSLGLSLLASFFNIRLGYWWDSGIEPKSRGKRFTGRLVGRALRTLYPVHSHFADEALSRFHGTARRRFWNLSDGGHFENMGAYELVRRRLPLIVVVDAEADPEYKFAGLANLIRKARIDFGAEICFLTDQELSTGKWKRPGDGGPWLGSLDKIRAASGGRSEAHAALARVCYSDDPRQQSVLVYIKAAVVGEEPVDVGAYKAAKPAFPQETTADQFFDEAQWESYRKLGEFIAGRVFGDGVDVFLNVESGA